MPNIAVIVESRKLPNLDLVIQDHMKYLPGWEYDIVDDKDMSNPFWHYNGLLTSIDFWQEYIDFERVLIFQHDSRLLREGVEEFMEWDYVGSPWYDGAPWAHPLRKGGNGGLSLRNPRVMTDTINSKKWYHTYGNEDVYFVKYIEQAGGKLAPYEVCKKFACETVFELNTFGYHQIESYMSPQQVKKIRLQYVA